MNAKLSKADRDMMARADYAAALTYFGSVLGENSSWYDDVTVFGHSSLKPYHEGGEIPFAAEVAWNGGKPSAWINDSLETDLLFRLIGFCAYREIPYNT